MKWVIVTLVLTFFALFAPLYYVFGQDVNQLRLQEMNLWSKLESSMLSTQNEIDGLQSLVDRLQQDSVRQTNELELSQMDKELVSKQLESTASSFSKLLTDYNSLKLSQQKLIKILVIVIAILAVLVINWAIDLIFWIRRRKFLWWG
jgi:hypothetical protein